MAEGLSSARSSISTSPSSPGSASSFVHLNLKSNYGVVSNTDSTAPELTINNNGSGNRGSARFYRASSSPTLTMLLSMHGPSFLCEQRASVITSNIGCDGNFVRSKYLSMHARGGEYWLTEVYIHTATGIIRSRIIPLVTLSLLTSGSQQY